MTVETSATKVLRLFRCGVISVHDWESGVRVNVCRGVLETARRTWAIKRRLCRDNDGRRVVAVYRLELMHGGMWGRRC